jgi:hypothetical protein
MRWGAGLNPVQFGQAVAALGVLEAVGRESRRARPDPDVLSERLQSLVQKAAADPSKTLAWRAPSQWSADAGAGHRGPWASDYAKLWAAHVNDASSPLTAPRICIDAAKLNLKDSIWMTEILGHATASLPYVGRPSLGTGTEWSWPLRIGFLDDGESKALRRQFESGPDWLKELVATDEASGPESEWDLLIASTSLEEVTQRLVQTRHGVDAGCLLALGGIAPTPKATAATLERALKESLDPWAVVVASVPTPGRSDWLWSLVEQLSHDATLDVALGALRDPVAPPSLLVAAPAALDAQHLARIAQRVVEAIEAAEEAFFRPAEEMLYIPEEVGSALGTGPGSFRRDWLAEAVVERMRYAHETAGATAVVAMSRLRRAQRPTEDRWLQAQATRPGRSEALRGALRRRRIHELRVRVGPADLEWAVSPEVFPQELLPQDQKRHLLRLVLQGLDSRSPPTIRKVHLPPSGPSDVAVFRIRPQGQQYRARLIVQFRNRVLQTALVTAKVADADQAPTSDLAITLQREAVVRAPAAPLTGRRAFDASFVHNHVPHGPEVATGIAGDWVKRLRLSDVRAQSTGIVALLNRVAGDPAAYRKLDSGPTVELLYGLAVQGVNLRSGLFPAGLPAGLERTDGPVRRIQIVAADPQAFLPLEFLYEYPPPAKAALCRNAVAALRAGRCKPGTYHHARPGGAVDVVCPSGFLSMSAVIERHGRDQLVEDLEQYDYGLRSDPVNGRDALRPLHPALYAASARVKEKDSAAVQRALGKLTGRKAARAVSWSDWLTAVETQGPALMVLLSHTALDDVTQSQALEIAEADLRPAGLFTRAYIRDDKADPGPVMLLLGCETGVPWQEYQTWTVRFRDQGAAVVVGTVATAPASHAARVATGLAGQLKSRRAKTSAFGDVLLHARQRMLAKGEVMALCLTSYGDAEWRLA